MVNLYRNIIQFFPHQSEFGAVPKKSAAPVLRCLSAAVHRERRRQITPRGDQQQSASRKEDFRFLFGTPLGTQRCGVRRRGEAVHKV